MRRMFIGLAALLVMVSGASAQEKRMTEQERRELEQKLDQLRTEMRQLERQLGRREMVYVSPRGMSEAPMAMPRRVRLM